jgi:hypothetical protein
MNAGMVGPDQQLVSTRKWAEADMPFSIARRQALILRPRWRLIATAAVAVVALEFFTVNAEATVYGCSIAGQWKCLPTPTKCYRNSSYLDVVKYPNYAACQARRSGKKN